MKLEPTDMPQPIWCFLRYYGSSVPGRRLVKWFQFIPLATLRMDAYTRFSALRES